MNNLKKISFGIAALMVAAVASAADPAGTWNGKLQLDMKKLEAQMAPMMKNATDQQKAAFREQMKKSSDMSIVLVLKANKSATVKMSGAAARAGAKDQAGTWSIAGNTVTVKMETPAGAPKGANNQPLVLKLSADGKGMTGDIPGAPGGGTMGKLAFKKA